MSLVLRDHLLNDNEISNNSLSAMPYISEEDYNSAEVHSSQFSIQYLDNGHLQIGTDEDAKHTFQLNLLIKNVMNLDTLLPEDLVFQHKQGNYFLSFKILGVAIKTKPFRKNFHNSITLNEKIVVIILSNRETLEKAFASEKIMVSFHHGQELLGLAEVLLGNIFSEKNLKGFFTAPLHNSAIPYGASEKSPFIEIEALVEQKLEETISEEICEKPKLRTIFSNMSRRTIAQEDEAKHNSVKDMDNNMKGDFCTSLQTDSVEGIVMDMIPLSSRSNGYHNTYQKYVVQIKFKSLTWKTIPEDTKVMFKILHPRTKNHLSIFTNMKDTDNEIILNNLEVRVAYISSVQMIQKLLRTWQPRLVLTNEREVPLCSEHILDVDCLNGRLEYHVMLKISSKFDLAKISAQVWLESVDLEDSEETDHLYLLPVIVDEVITIKEVTELERWKKQTRIFFEKELENIKEQETLKLADEWRAKKAHLENQLTAAVDKCKALQQDLETKADILKIEKSLQRNKNSNKIYEDIFDGNWKLYGKDNSREVIEALSKSQRDNQLLKLMLNEQKEKLEQIEKSNLTKAQTSNLLQELKVLEERFEQVQCAKRYFKEQWINACQEIHDIRTDEVASLQAQIKSSKEELGLNNVPSAREDYSDWNWK